MIDFSRITGPQSFPLLNEIAAEVDWRDLPALTNELYDALAAELTKVDYVALSFVPNDPKATAGDEVGYMIPQIIAHLTATQEEAAAHAAQLARGSVPEGRSRYETPSEGLQTVEQVRNRLQESRRICLAYLQAWPDQPHFEVTFVPFPIAGPQTALVRYLTGMFHTNNHLEQLRDVVGQAITSAM